jgi:hypothetical protein
MMRRSMKMRMTSRRKRSSSTMRRVSRRLISISNRQEEKEGKSLRKITEMN